jgi:hypothetical protein
MCNLRNQSSLSTVYVCTRAYVTHTRAHARIAAYKGKRLQWLQTRKKWAENDGNEVLTWIEVAESLRQCLGVCTICSRVTGGVGVFFSSAHGGSKSNPAAVVYRLCPECNESPDCDSDVESLLYPGSYRLAKRAVVVTEEGII